MKLRNKKTGKHGDYSIGTGGDLLEVRNYWDDSEVYQYDSIAKFYERWEDYAPAEPLIKDEKIRKAVRAWAYADDLDNFRLQNQHFNECKIIGYTAGINKASFIGFQTTIAHADNKKLYTVTELCGEEEQCES